METPIAKFRQSSIIYERPDCLPEKWKTLTNSNCHRVQSFLLKFCTRSLLNPYTAGGGGVNLTPL